MAKITIRPAAHGHRSLILDSFVKRYQSTVHGRGVSWRVLAPKMEALLNSPKWEASIATPEDDADAVMGFCVYQKPVRAAWLHVKGLYRRLGVAKALWYATGIAATEIECAFITPEMVDIARRHAVTLRFRPYIPDSEQQEAEEEFENIIGTVIGGGK